MALLAAEAAQAADVDHHDHGGDAINGRVRDHLHRRTYDEHADFHHAGYDRSLDDLHGPGEWWAWLWVAGCRVLRHVLGRLAGLGDPHR